MAIFLKFYIVWLQTAGEPAAYGLPAAIKNDNCIRPDFMYDTSHIQNE
jgi:hypothetical protein